MIDGKILMDKAAEEVIKANMAGDTSLAARVAALEAKVKAVLPTEAGTYNLKVTVDGTTVSYSYEAVPAAEL